MRAIHLRDDDPATTLTLDRLIEELMTLRRSGQVSGSEHVAIGVEFMAQSIAAKSVCLLGDAAGRAIVGISAESELEWNKAIEGLESLDSK
jgi:hypothetical protein